MFRVGQKVTMIAPHQFESMCEDEVQPVFGDIYTVRCVVNIIGRLALIFDEIKNPRDRYHNSGEACFNARRFRPIVERKTDISVFDEILRRESAPSTLVEA